MINEQKIRKAFKPTNIDKNHPQHLKEAAVIVPFLFKNSRWFLIFEKRPQINIAHAGQISFPGGSKGEQDKNFLYTAIRETCEEINICKKDLEIIGNIEPITTLTTNFIIYPFLAIVKKQPPYEINKSEVEKLIFIPLDFLIEQWPIKYRKYNYKGTLVKTPLIEFEGEIIWGATARLLNKLLPKLKE